MVTSLFYKGGIGVLKEIQVNKTKEMVYAMDEDSNVIARFPCSKAFVDGENSAGQAFDNAEDGTYEEGSEGDTEIMYPNNLTEDNIPYGWAYINIDARGRALHGGGSGLADPFAPYQDALLPTHGCFRMYNADVFWLAQAKKRSEATGIDVVITVVEDN